MGSMTRMGRCARFIGEFSKDAVRIHGKPFKKALSPMGLGEHEGFETVFLFGVVLDSRREQVEVMLPSPLFFDPEEPESDLIERVQELFDLSKAVAKKRLKKAELI